MQQVKSFPWSIDLSDYGLTKDAYLLPNSISSAPWALGVQEGQPELSHMEPNDKSLVLEPLKTCGNHCLLIFALWEQPATGWILDTGYQWLYQTNSFIILLVRQSVFKFECMFARAPGGQRFEKPRNKAVPCLVLYFFDNGSLAKKGGLKTKRRMTLPEYVQPWQWESMTRNRKTYRLKPNQYNNPLKESIETDCKQHGCRGSSIWITAAMR